VKDDDAGGPVPRGARGVLRQSGTTSVAAGAAVLSGLVLDVAIAAALGAGASSDAFFASATIPLGIVAIVMVGANQALVPAISTWLVKRDEPDAWRLVSAVLNRTAVLGAVLVAAAIPLAGPLMRLTAPGFDDATTAAAASALRVMMLVAPLVALAEVLRALLNARHRFAAPAAMNVVMNAVAAALVAFVVRADATAIATAYVVGAAAQLAFMVSMALRAGWRWRPTLGARDAEVRATGRLLVRPLAGAALNPLARIGEQLFVSFLPAGSLTIMRYGYRLVSAIGGAVLFRSVIVVLLPRLTRATAAGEEREVRQLARLGLRIMLVLSAALTALMAVLSKPAALALFHRGRFTADEAALLGVTLAVYAASIPGSGIQRALLAPFFARLDTSTPFRNTLYGVLANLVLVPVCLAPFGRVDEAVIGVAIAYSLAQYVNVAHAWVRLRAIGLRVGVNARTVVSLLVAAGASATVMIAGRLLLDLDAQTQRVVLLAETVLVGVVGLLVFGAVAAALGLDDLRRLRGDAGGAAAQRPPDRGVDDEEDEGRPPYP
jgi:murein biosynthesis integral membrane protein MurJ